MNAVKLWNAWKPLALAAVLVFGVVGCKEVEVEDGEIPSEYLSAAAAYMGEYKGHYEGRPASLELSLDGNRAVLKFRDNRGSDLLMPICFSKIGDLLAVTVDRRDDNPWVLKAARFLFDPGMCPGQAAGRQVYLSFRKRDGRQVIELSLHKETKFEQFCYWTPGAPEHGIPPRYECRPEPRDVYLRGRFTK